jgi:hypothetical protein
MRRGIRSENGIDATTGAPSRRPRSLRDTARHGSWIRMMKSPCSERRRAVWMAIEHGPRTTSPCLWPPTNLSCATPASITVPCCPEWTGRLVPATHLAASLSNAPRGVFQQIARATATVVAPWPPCAAQIATGRGSGSVVTASLLIAVLSVGNPLTAPPGTS